MGLLRATYRVIVLISRTSRRKFESAFKACAKRVWKLGLKEGNHRRML